MKKRLRVIAGPNGSGKTSLYHKLKEQINLYDFINADEMKLLLEEKGNIELPFELEHGEMQNDISKTSFAYSVKELFYNGLITSSGCNIIFSPDAINSYSIAAFADFLRNAYLRRGISFTTETVFSHPSKLDFLSKAKDEGYRIYLYCIATESPFLNVERVAQRRASGGHDVPVDKIVSRYKRCLGQFFDALNYAYRAFFWDNSTQKMLLFAEMKPDLQLEIVGKTPNWFEEYILKKVDR